MRGHSLDVACRPADDADLAEIAAVYALCVRQGDGAFDDTYDAGRLALKYRDLLARRVPFVVACRNDRVIGFAHTDAYHPGSGFAHCGNLSIWIRLLHRGTGVGTRLLEALLRASAASGYRQILSWVLSDNAPGLALHRRCGFAIIGWHREACQVGGTLRDIVLLRHDLARFLAAAELAARPEPLRLLVA